ncbi:hypothetical protein F8388_004335 [Cannabis sativa]|uniref:Uncharacterized protein n=1 Tax=Cannabis sativa TaxID=3483 RepID=A0A7J6H9P9_CANSA|nr:hypothetical protein F8388_004335 [Cannabis sativa]
MADALSFECYDKSGGLVELSGPKIITLNNYMKLSNTENKLVAFDCDTMIIMASTLHEHSIASGCLLFCTKNFNMSFEITCSGLGCCHTPIPKHLKHFSLETTGVNNHTDSYYFNPCSYSENGLGYRCVCKNGYQGNPYHKQGCQDINECLEPQKCRGGSCQNTDGSYTCKCPLGMRGDARDYCEGYHLTPIIVTGGFASVYKGVVVIPNATTTTTTQQIAVKKPKLQRTEHNNKNANINHQQFYEEISIVSQVNHKNVVKLLGLCLETEIPLLVYELVPNGTLSQHIHGITRSSSSSSSSSAMLRPWKTHENYTAKVSDFGASVLIPPGQSGIATTVQGTLGYLDPEYLSTGTLTSKSDVYSFGAVLVELITGEKPISNGIRSNALRITKRNKIFLIEKILDPEIIISDHHQHQERREIEVVARLAKICLSGHGVRRPTMKQVAEELVGLNTKPQHQHQYQEETGQILVDHGQTPSSSFSITHNMEIIESSSFL